MFDGDRRRNNQSGASSRPLTREELLQQNTVDRKQREIGGQHDNASRVLQRFVRRALDKSRARTAGLAAIRREFDAGWAAYTSRTTTASISPAEHLLDLSRLLVSVHERQQDFKRVLSVCAAIVKSVPADGAASSSNFFSVMLSSEVGRARSFCVCLRRLVLLCLDSLVAGSSTAQGVESPQAFGLVLSCLLLLIDTSKWRLVGLSLDDSKVKGASDQIERLFWVEVFAPLQLPLFEQLSATLANLLALEYFGAANSSGSSSGSSDAKVAESKAGAFDVYISGLLLVALRGFSQPASLQHSASSISLQSSYVRVPVEALFASRLLPLPLLGRHLLAHSALRKLLSDFQCKHWIGVLRALHAALFPFNGAEGGAALPRWLQQPQTAAASPAAALIDSLGIAIRRRRPRRGARAAASPARTAFQLAAAAASPAGCVLGNVLLLGTELKSHAAELQPSLLYLELVTGLLELVPEHVLARQPLRTRIEERVQARVADSKATEIKVQALESKRGQTAVAAKSLSRVGWFGDLMADSVASLFAADVLPSILARLAVVENDAGQPAAYSLTLASRETTQAVLARFARTQNDEPALAPAAFRFLRVALERCRQARSVWLSLLTFSSPLLVCAWAWLRSTIEPAGSAATVSSAAVAGKAKAEQKRSGPAASTAAAAAPSASASVERWCSCLWSAIEGSPLPDWWSSLLLSERAASRGLVDCWQLLLACYAPVLFVLDDEELLANPVPFTGGPRGLAEFAQLVKATLFRLLWHKDRVPAALAARLVPLCQRLIMDLYRRDVRAPFMHHAAIAEPALAQDAGGKSERKKAESVADAKAGGGGSSSVEFDGRYWLVGENESEWHRDWQSWLSGSKRRADRERRQQQQHEADDEEAQLQQLQQQITAAMVAERKLPPGARVVLVRQPRGGAGAGPGAGGAAAAAAAGGVPQPDADAEDEPEVDSLRVLHVLQQMPFVVAFDERVRLLRRMLDAERGPVVGLGLYELTIRRDRLVEDSLVAISRIGSAFRKKLAVRFLEETTGEAEKGVDLGGVMKEWLELTLKELLRPERGLFRTTPAGLLHPSPDSALAALGGAVPGAGAGDIGHAAAIADGLRLMALAGKLVGKALAEGILVDVPFAPFFLARLLGQATVLADLATLDAELYKNLNFVKKYEGDVAELTLTFSVTDDEFGATRTVELRPGGSNITVTNFNRIEYVYRVADHHLSRKSRLATAAFIAGFSELVAPESLRMFNTSELQLLLSGSTTDIDVADWRAFTVYEGCSASSSSVKAFWKAVEEMKGSDRQALLRFVTSCSRPPLLGFKYLNPPFTIRLIPATATAGGGGIIASLFGRGPKNLPMASTCFNMLKLPDYGSSKSTMAEKLKIAIHSGAGGFHLA